jgi:hypothetical protein
MSNVLKFPVNQRPAPLSQEALEAHHRKAHIATEQAVRAKRIAAMKAGRAAMIAAMGDDDDAK